uniref:Uncharacterized protein LOC114340205 n=1 Tax=Diabrotica virgifera virgifera TaxID=50390 RepID=A0A6P7GBS6_DIAVI
MYCCYSSGGIMKNVRLVVFCVFLGSLVKCEISNTKFLTTSTRSSVMSIPKQESNIPRTIKDQNKTLDGTTLTKGPIIRQNEVTTPESTTRTETTNTEPVVDLECPELSTIPNLNKYTQEELILLLTDGCRYDRLIKPPGEQIEVFFRMDITHIESADHLIISNTKFLTTSTRSSVMSIPKPESNIPRTIKDQNKTLDGTTSTKGPIIRQNEVTTPESTTRTETTNTEPVVDLECPELSTIPNLNKYTQEELILLLTDGCRYDRLIKPPGEQIEVFFRMDITHIESADHL